MKYFLIFFFYMASLSCRVEENKVIPLRDPSTNSEGKMTDSLRKLDVTAVGSPIIRSFQRSGKGELIFVRFTNPYADNNINLRIEVILDSNKNYIFPLAYAGNKRKGYRSPSLAYKEGSYYSLPMQKGLPFERHCRVNFIVDPVVDNPVPKGKGRGTVENIEIVWN